jgi:hypothetical protein
MKFLRYNDTIATPALKLLDLYLCMWDSYVVKSTRKLQLEEEQRQLQVSTKWLASDSDILMQICSEQALVLWYRSRG